MNDEQYNRTMLQCAIDEIGIWPENKLRCTLNTRMNNGNFTRLWCGPLLQD
jgi:hypothetical protein